tara:strand:+ start:6289 stop:7251 length:963 start_codon:yes stop_codon:yes gene_type:complete
MVKIITEFCQNHNGNFENLKKMVEEAAKAGATHGKIQNIYSKNLTFRPQFENGLELNGIIHAINRPYEAEYKRLKNLELSEKNNKEFINICNDNGLIPMTTIFVKGDSENLKKIGFKSIKIASYDCASFQLIREIKEYFSEIVISTGATFDEEIIKTSQILNESEIDFTFLHAITIYPTPLNEVNLNRMNFLRNFTKSVGYSDHTETEKNGIDAVLVSIFLGANYIERHFTILNPNETRDGKVSVGPEHIKQIAEFSVLNKESQKEYLDSQILNWKNMLGSEKRSLSKIELLNRDYYRGRFAKVRDGYGNSSMNYNYEEI